MYKYTANPSLIKKYIRMFLEESLTPENRKLFFSHPDSDFTRNRKLGLETLVFHLLSRSSESLTHNLQTDFGLGNERPSKSALVQQMSKLKIDFFCKLFDCINNKLHRSYLYKGKYKLLACDGSDLAVSSENKDCFRGTNQTGKPFHSIHINALSTTAQLSHKTGNN